MDNQTPMPRPPSGYRPYTSTRPPSGSVNSSTRPPSGSVNTSNRPPSGNVNSSRGAAPGTASRLISAASARPGSRSSVAIGIGVSSHINIADRPMTQQGLATPRTSSRMPKRQVQDKSYFMGLLRSKTTELTNEINSLSKEIDLINKEHSTFLTYEKRAEILAAELKELQGNLADYNLLVDKLNTDAEIDEVVMEAKELSIMNDRELKIIEQLFEQRSEREVKVRQIEQEIEQERHMTDNLIEAMKPELRERYNELKITNQTLHDQQEQMQHQIDAVNARKIAYEDELMLSQVKQEAFNLFQKLRELEEKRDLLIEEDNARGTPAQERERLLQQVKDDNSELASIERQTVEVREQIGRARDELEQVEQELEENQGERANKYHELRKREETMKTFLDTFPEKIDQENERRASLENQTVTILENISRNLAHFQHLPSPKELGNLKEDLAFKEGEMEKSRSTASTLEHEQKKLSMDLQKIEQLETKIQQEMESLNQKIQMMEGDIVVFSDLELLKTNAEMKKTNLTAENEELKKRKETSKEVEAEKAAEYESLFQKLNENETYTDLKNLERKWQHQEQINYTMKENIETKKAECDYSNFKKSVFTQISQINTHLQEQLNQQS